MTSPENLTVLPVMALCRSDVADTAVAMLVVVPGHQLSRPASGLFQGREPAHRELGPTLRGTEQRFGVRVVVGHPRARVGGLDAEPVQHRQHRGRL